MLTYLGEGYHEIFREIHVCNLFSNGQEEKNGVTEIKRMWLNVFNGYIQIEYMSTGSSHL